MVKARPCVKFGDETQGQELGNTFTKKGKCITMDILTEATDVVKCQSSAIPCFQGATEQVGDSSNTHLHTSQTNELERGGVDSVVWNLGVTWGFGLPVDDLMGSLGAGKLQAQEVHDKVVIVINGWSFGIFGGGKGTGGGRGTYYSYLIEHEGLMLKITKAPKADEEQKNQNVVVECGSLFLMAHGFDLAWASVRLVVEALGGRIMWHKFSRLDICADLAGIEAEQFVQAVWDGKYIARASKKSYYEDGRRRTGVTVGKNDIVLRIYDKLHEVTIAKPDKTKELILVQKRWGKSPSNAVRVEFQLRRPALNELGIDTMSDFWTKGASVSKYLTVEWFRLLEQVPDAKNNHQSRCDTATIWNQVQHAFESWLRKPRQPVERKKRAFCKDSLRLGKQAMGCMMSAIVDLTQEMHMDREEFRLHLREALDWGVDQMDDTDFRKKYTRKTAQRLVGYPGAVLPREPRTQEYTPWVHGQADVGVLKRWKGVQAHG